MNCYATLGDVKADLGITVTTHDAVLLRYLKGVSRGIDRFCGRHFFVRSEERFEAPGRVDELVLSDDVLSVSSLTTGCRCWRRRSFG